MELKHRETVDKVVGDLESRIMGGESRILLVVLDLRHLLIEVDAEDCLDYDHRQNDAHNAERIGSGISHRHLLAHGVSVGDDLQVSLLRGTESGSIGDGTAHDAHHLRDGSLSFRASLNEIDGKHYAHV